MGELESQTGIGLDRTAVLQRAPELTLQVGSDGSTVIEMADRIIQCGRLSIAYSYRGSRVQSRLEVARATS